MPRHNIIVDSANWATKLTVRFAFLLLLTLLLPGCTEQSAEQTVTSEPAKQADSTPSDERPNILLVVLDDVGYSDLGAYGSSIQTPVMDALTKEGVMFTQFHVFPNCGPTRGAMMTGVDPHRAGMGGNHGANAANQEGQPGYEGHLRKDVVTIAQLLRDSGYHTYVTGKWHLGRDENDPSARGFEKSFVLLNGAASHWADQGAIIPGSPTRYSQDGQIVEELPDDFYSSTWYTDKLISYIDSDQGDDAPFFAFLSFTAPHNPLHVPQEYIDNYRGQFDAGWDELADKRLARQRALGLAGESQQPHPRPDWVMAWDELSAEQQAERARDMEIYAGMIDFVDESVGRMFARLRDLEEYDNTLIVVISDNGPSKTSIADYLALGGDVGEFFNSFDNSMDNRGLPGSSTDIGPGWAYAAATPLRLFKGYVTQGGIQVPAIIKLPETMTGAAGRIGEFAHVKDLMPTFLSVADAEYPVTYNGTPIVPLQGESLIPMLTGEVPEEPQSRGIGWSAYGMNAYRKGDWKALKLPEPFGNGDWQLYNLADDPGELNDLASEYPQLVTELASAWQDYADTNGVIQPDAPTAYSKPIVGRKH